MELCHISYKLTCIDYIQDWLASALKEYAAVLDDAALADQFLDRRCVPLLPGWLSGLIRNFSFALEAKDVDWTDMTWLKVIQYYEEETETKQVETGWKSRFSFKFLSSTSLRS